MCEKDALASKQPTKKGVLVVSGTSRLCQEHETQELSRAGREQRQQDWEWPRASQELPLEGLVCVGGGFGFWLFRATLGFKAFGS